MLRHIIAEAAALHYSGGAAVSLQRVGCGAGGFDFQHIMSECRRIHGQHHISVLEDFTHSALQLCGPTVLPKVP